MHGPGRNFVCGASYEKTYTTTTTRMVKETCVKKVPVTTWTTVQEVCVEPAAAGLDLICEGIRRTSPSDDVALERGAMIYEALYAQLAVDSV